MSAGPVQSPGAADDARDAARYRKMRAWFVRGPRLSDIAPYGHMQVTTEAVVDDGVDALPAPAFEPASPAPESPRADAADGLKLIGTVTSAVDNNLVFRVYTREHCRHEWAPAGAGQVCSKCNLFRS